MKDNKKEVIDIKCIRLNSPNIKNNSKNLNGLYNNLLNEEYENYYLENKSNSFELTSQYNISSNCGFYLNKIFGPAFIGDELNILFIILNKTNSIIQIEKIYFNIYSDDPNMIVPFNCNIPSKISLKEYSFYSFVFYFKVEKKIKYKIEFKCLYEDIEYGIYENKMFKNGYNYEKILTIEGKNPFNINTNFTLIDLEKCYISQILENLNKITLKINKIWLSTNKEPKTIIELKTKFEELYLHQKESISLLYEINDQNIFNYERKFLLNIEWQRINELNKYLFQSEIRNTCISYNEFFAIELKEKPNVTLIKDQTFKIILLIYPKINEKLNIYISCDNDDKGKVINILDIIEENIELFNNPEEICLICKSRYVGNISFPTIKFKFKFRNQQNCISMNNILCLPILKEINLI